MTATGMQFPKTMARQSAEFADEYIKGRRDFPQKVPVPVELVTQDNVGQIRRLRKEIIHAPRSAGSLPSRLSQVFAGGSRCFTLCR